MSLALVSLGSNVGDRRRRLDDALAVADGCELRVVRRSAWYETAPVGGPPNQPPFLNGVALLETALEPEPLLGRLQQLEIAGGRERAERWGPRTLDVDLLFYEDRVVRSATLTLPHPRAAFRKFVLRGAAEIAPDWRHPLLRRTLRELLTHLETAPNYVCFVGLSDGFRSQLAGEAAERAGARLVEPTGNSVPATAEAAGSDGLDSARAIEFVRARFAAIERSTAEAAGRWVVDDAWIAAEAAMLAERLPATERSEFAAAFESLRQTSPLPKLLAVPGPPTSAPHGAALAVCEAFASAGPLPPVVDLNVADREGALAEFAAALEAAA